MNVRQMKVAQWDRRFLDMASLAATWSKDPKRQVGAVVAGSDRRPYIGYNGFPPQIMDDCTILATEAKHEFMIHAEINAILNCPVPTRGMTMYSTLPPCTECAKFMVQAGIIRVVTLRQDPDWHMRHPLPSIFKKARIEVSLYAQDVENCFGPLHL